MLGTGWVASAGALIFAAAERENRYACPNTRFLLHEPRGGVGGTATDVEIQAREILEHARASEPDLRQRHRPAAGPDQDATPIAITGCAPEEAIEYGLVGKIVRHRNEIV